MNSQDQEVLLKNLKALAKENNLDISAEIAKIEQKMETSARAVDRVWEKVSIARNPERPRTLDYIEMIFDDFTELHGDRLYGDDLYRLADDVQSIPFGKDGDCRASGGLSWYGCRISRRAFSGTCGLHVYRRVRWR